MACYGQMDITKCNYLDYLNILLASTDAFTCTEAARCHVDKYNSPHMALLPVFFEDSLRTQKRYEMR